MVNRIRYFVGMEKQMEIAGHLVIICYKRVKHINMRLQATPQGGLVSISAPRRVTMREIAAFVTEKTAWIEKNMAQLAARAPKALSYEEGALHLLWGEAYPLKIEQVRRGQGADFDGAAWHLRIRTAATADEKAALMEAAYKRALLSVTEPLMAQWAAKMGVRPQQLKTQKMRSRWGSCQVTRCVIKLNSELARRPQEQLEYVLVHELVHLFERGHNARFYGFMDKFLPDWRARKQRLNATAQYSV